MNIKQTPEDFIVKELASIPFTDSGEYAYFLLRKKEWNTMDAVKEIAERLSIPMKKLSYAGIKDKKAVTEQYISIQGVPKEKVLGLKIKDIELVFLGYAKERMNNNMLNGNAFRITLRALEKEIKIIPKLIPNYFDEQRFGFKARNHLAGKAIVQKDFKKACEYMGISSGGQPVDALIKKRDNTVLCFHAYQSYLFNLVLAEYVKRHAKDSYEVSYNAGTMAFGDVSNVRNIAIPILHFDAEFDNDEVKRMYERVLGDEGVRLSDFLVRQMPFLIQTSPSRMALAAVKDFQSLEFSDDELNKGLKKQTVSFSLGKGSYATVVVKALEALE
ncbi:MAG: tRNA pseudouridine(13) synthase TruD [Nanoarchaeota archaeon]|nr:tRNA pseudouridine(13) synthase TruD [Nanoarchaeota archaeon]